MDDTWMLPVAFLISAIAVGLYTSRSPYYNYYENRNILSKGKNTPTVWIYYDDSDVNSRSWLDFMGRSSRALNLPFLNLCYETIFKACGQDYHIEAIYGLGDAAQRLGGWDALPAPMRNKRLPLRSEEMMYLRVAFMEKYGGLWVSPSSLFLKDIGKLPEDKVAFFGTDPNETYSGPKGTFIPNIETIWSPKSGHDIFTSWRTVLYSRIEASGGGMEVRRDQDWDMNIIYKNFPGQYVLLPYYELSRKHDGKLIYAEDILAVGTEGNLPFPLHQDTVFVRVPYKDLLERRPYGWFLRLSEEQILESDLVFTHLLKFRY